MIIDFTTHEPMMSPRAVDEPAEPGPGRADPFVQMEREAWDACKHSKMQIDQKQRTVKCGDCKMWLDPVWCLGELFHYYQTRVDRRLEAIQAFEARQEAEKERRLHRKKQPREALLKRRQESLERAAYNEYQAKLLTIRAGKQRATAERIEEVLNCEGVRK